MSESTENHGVLAWELLLRTHAALVPRLSQQVEEAAGLPLSWYDVMLELSRAPDRRLRMSELGERVVLSRSQVSRLVDAMVAAGYVTKEPDPTDGRATLALLTPDGLGSFRRAAPVYLAGIEREFVSRLTSQQIGGIKAGLARVLRAIDR